MLFVAGLGNEPYGKESEKKNTQKTKTVLQKMNLKSKLPITLIVMCILCLPQAASSKSELVFHDKDNTFEYYYRPSNWFKDTMIQWVLRNITPKRIAARTITAEYLCSDGTTEKQTHYFMKTIESGQKRGIPSDYVCKEAEIQLVTITGVEYEIDGRAFEKYPLSCPGGKVKNLTSEKIRYNVYRIKSDDGFTWTLDLKNYNENEFKSRICPEANTPDLLLKVRSKVINKFNKWWEKYCKRYPQKCKELSKPPVKSGTGIIG